MKLSGGVKNAGGRFAQLIDSILLFRDFPAGVRLLPFPGLRVKEIRQKPAGKAQRRRDEFDSRCKSIFEILILKNFFGIKQENPPRFHGVFQLSGINTKVRNKK